jgi:alkylhydroperoxidase/carboxymuconolactone decarboxylase family protein YurZ
MNSMSKNPMEIFQNEAPNMAESFNSLIMALVEHEGLDPKTKQLMYVAMKTSMGDEKGCKSSRANGKTGGGDK